MHLEILSPEQKELLPLINSFKRRFYLVGGTAIALHIGNRMSIDYDLFCYKTFSSQDILKNITKFQFALKFKKNPPPKNDEGHFQFFYFSHKTLRKQKLNSPLPIVRLPLQCGGALQNAPTFRL